MKTLIGAAEPEPRPVPLLVGVTTTTAAFTTSTVGGVSVTLTVAPVPNVLRGPIRTQAWVDKHREIEAPQW